MAAPFYVLPTTDIHLVTNSSLIGGNTFSLDTLNDGGDSIDLSKITFAEFDPAIVTVTKDTCYSVVVNEAFCPDTSDYYCIYDVKVEEQSLENQVKLYPNPTKGIVTISAPALVWAQIYTLDGRVVQTNHKTNKLSLENLSSGVYFIRITDEKGKLIKIELVVKE